MSARVSPVRLAVCVLPLFVSACGGGSSSSSDNGGGGGPPETVEFTLPGQQIEEAVITVQAFVTLSTPLSHDVQVHWSFTGDAKYFDDFFIPTPSPLIIHELQTSAVIKVNIFTDDRGELDETITLTIVAVTGAEKGSHNTHTITIVDDDETKFQEMEPNDDLGSANSVGDIGKGTAWEITGDVSPPLSGDEVDIFVLTVLQDVDIDFELDPSSIDSKMNLLLTDAAGTKLDNFAAGGPGATVTGLYSALEGTLLYLHVSTDLETDYFLDAVGLEFLPSPDHGPSDDAPEFR